MGRFPMVTLDSVDMRILDKDASQSLAQIAGQVHLSQNACWHRILDGEDQAHHGHSTQTPG